MREQTLLQMRTVVDRQGQALQQVVLPGLRDVTQNEAVTRRRVTTLEDRCEALEYWQGSLTVWDRLRWLFIGRLPRETEEAASVKSGLPTDAALRY